LRFGGCTVHTASPDKKARTVVVSVQGLYLGAWHSKRLRLPSKLKFINYIPYLRPYSFSKPPSPNQKAK
jgi:hypothetical protein